MRLLSRSLLIAVTAALAACQTNPKTATVIAQPKTPIVRTITSFSDSLRCMDQLFLDFGVRNVRVTSDGIPDETAKIAAGTKDIMITALSKMSERSEAFEFIDIEQHGVVEFLINRRGNDRTLFPRFFIRGAVTQLDQHVARDSEAAGVAFPFLRFGIARNQVLSMLTVDMNIGNTQTRSIIPGMHTTNTITLIGRDQAGDVEGLIGKADLYFEISRDYQEGTHQSLRTIIELSLIEVLGKLAKVPYWKCLELDSTDPTYQRQALQWYDSIPASERVRVVQQAMAQGGLYAGQVDGLNNAEFVEAVNRYQASHDLIANGRVDFDLYYRLLLDNYPVTPAGEAKQSDFLQATNARPTSESTQAPDYQPASPASPMPRIEASGGHIGLDVQPAGGRQETFQRGDTISIRVSTERLAHVYCYYEYPTGQHENGRVEQAVVRLFPNQFQSANQLRPGQVVVIPADERNFRIRLKESLAYSRIGCIATEIDYPPGSDPEPALASPLKPLPSIRNLNHAIDLHTDVDHLSTDVQVFTWRVR